MTNGASRIVTALTPVVSALEQLEVAYYVGGSVASSAYGILRATFDVDIVAEIRQEHVSSLVRLLEGNYYVDYDAIRNAIRLKSSVSIIYLDTMTKIDIFIPKDRAFAQVERSRIREEILVEGTPAFVLSSPEDIVINKLEWYKMKKGVSDTQWNDILGVLKVQETNLDFAYMLQWAETLGVDELLQRALTDAGLS